MKLWPGAHHERRTQDWVTFPCRGGAYSPEEMLEPLTDLLGETWARYQTTRSDKGLNALTLLIHYDGLAFQYCTPVEAPDSDFADAAGRARAYVSSRVILEDEGTGVPFDSVFLFVALDGNEQAFRLY